MAMKIRNVLSLSFSVLVLAAVSPRVALAGGSECSSCGCGKSKAATSAAPSAAAKDIVDTAVSAGSFGTLVAAVQAAGLVDTLKGDGPFTVFLPTDEAFAKLPKGTIDALLKDKAALTKVLTYHVVAGRMPSGEAAKLTGAKTVQGGTLPIVADASGVKVGGARVVKADIEARNGVIHVIDTVLLP